MGEEILTRISVGADSQNELPYASFVARLLTLTLFTILYAISASAGDLRIVTYNIYKGQGLEKNPLSLRYFLTEHPDLRGTDVLAVQEICGDGNARQVEILTGLLSEPGKRVHSHFVSSDLGDGEECGKGQAIFSRFPILGKGSVLLPFIRQPRVMIWVDLKIGARNLRIYNLHLDNRAKGKFFIERERLLQIQGALSLILEYRRQNPEASTVVLGDFNSIGRVVDLWRKEAAIQEMKKYFTPSLNAHHMTTLPFLQLDWIFFDGLELVQSKVVRHFENSDHFPVVADFKL